MIPVRFLAILMTYNSDFFFFDFFSSSSFTTSGLDASLFRYEMKSPTSRPPWKQRNQAWLVQTTPLPGDLTLCMLKEQTSYLFGFCFCPAGEK